MWGGGGEGNSFRDSLGKPAACMSDFDDFKAQHRLDGVYTINDVMAEMAQSGSASCTPQRTMHPGHALGVCGSGPAQDSVMTERCVL